MHQLVNKDFENIKMPGTTVKITRYVFSRRSIVLHSVLEAVGDLDLSPLSLTKLRLPANILATKPTLQTSMFYKLIKAWSQEGE